MIEVAFHIRKDKFKAYPAVVEDLDLIEEDDQIVHTISLDEAVDPENMLSQLAFKLSELGICRRLPLRSGFRGARVALRGDPQGDHR